MANPVPKVVVKTVADVATLQTTLPGLKVATPLIVAGHPNEAAMAVHLNNAQTAPTPAMQADEVAYANQLATATGWRP